MAARVSKSKALSELAKQAYRVEKETADGHIVLLGPTGDHNALHLHCDADTDDFDREELLQALERQQDIDTSKLAL